MRRTGGRYAAWTRVGLMVVTACTIGTTPVLGQTPDVRGAWAADQYTLRGGPTHPVTGHIIFTDHEWTVLFFVMDGTVPRRGSAEGGTYTLEGRRLVFDHLYHLSVGDSLEGLPASPLRLTTRPRGTGTAEPSTIDIAGNRLIIAFPSGNTMSFRRVP